jgi:hypothetical protein
MKFTNVSAESLVRSKSVRASDLGDTIPLLNARNGTFCLAIFYTCILGEVKRMRPCPDIVGKRFGKLVVVERAGSERIDAGRHRALWRCVCDCGGERITPAYALTWGRTTSCGCNRYNRQSREQHGHSGYALKGVKPSPTYTAWRSMRVRCTEPTVRSYQRYGGRGITVCDRWLKFENFLADMGERPSSEHSLDRIDNDGPYDPANCRWATRIEQATNRAVVRRLEYRGKIYSLAALARFARSSEEVLRSRLKAGWTIAQAVETPVRPKRPNGSASKTAS